MTISIRKLALDRWRAVLAVGAAAPALADGRRPSPALGRLLVRRSVRHLRSGPAAARLQGLSRGLLGLPLDEPDALPHPGEKGGPFYDPHAENPADNRFVKALAAEIQVPDIDTETGEAIMRPAPRPTSSPTPIRTARPRPRRNGGAAPPDLSVMAKARHGGADYIYSLLTATKTPPAGLQHDRRPSTTTPIWPGDLTPFWEGDPEHVPAGGFIAMPPPLTEAGQVTYDDGTAATVDQMAKDVAAFIAWSSDPKATERKQSGVGVLTFLLMFAGVTYASYRRIWKGVAH